jgi:hypothetical protein
VTEALWKEYEEFATRDLSEVRPLYLFFDGIAEKLPAGAPREAVLAAVGDHVPIQASAPNVSRLRTLSDGTPRDRRERSTAHRGHPPTKFRG